MTGVLPMTPVASPPMMRACAGASRCTRGRFHELVYTRPVFGLNAIGTALFPRCGQISTSSPARNRLYSSVRTGRPLAAT
jgi:hypothetical protein